MATIMGIAKAIHFKEPKEYTTLVYVDGLSKNKRQEYGSEQCRHKKTTHKGW